MLRTRERGGENDRESDYTHQTAHSPRPGDRRESRGITTETMSETCNGQTADGEPCNNKTADGYCHLHENQGGSSSVETIHPDTVEARLGYEETALGDIERDQVARDVIEWEHENQTGVFKGTGYSPAGKHSVATNAVKCMIRQLPDNVESPYNKAFGTCSKPGCEKGRNGYETVTCYTHREWSPDDSDDSDDSEEVTIEVEGLGEVTGTKSELREILRD